MKRKTINRVRSAPKAYMSLAVEGQAVQVHSTATGETFPDRALIPLVLRPAVGYTLPDTGESDSDAARLLTDIHWYRLDGTNDKGLSPDNEITADMPGETAKRYDIETTPGSPDSGMLTVYVNTGAGKEETYVLVATLNVGEGRTVMASFRSECRIVEVAPELLFDNSDSALYNPWEDPDKFEVTPSVAPSTYKDVAYSWESLHSGKWVALGSTVLDWAVKADGKSGKLTIDRSVMQERIDLRCTAKVNIDGREVSVSRTLTHSRRLPWYEEDFLYNAALPAEAKTFSPMATGTLSKGVMTDFDKEVVTKWYDGSTLIATGQSPQIAAPPQGQTMDLGIEVRDRGGWCALADSDGVLLTDSDGALLIVREFE